MNILKFFPKITFLGACFINILLIEIPAKACDPQDESRQIPRSPWNLWHDCKYSPQEWATQLQKLKVYKQKHRSFTKDPDFMATYQILERTTGNIDLDDPLIGLICFQMTARKVGIAPIKQNYTDEDVDFIDHQIYNLASAIQMNMKDFKWVPQILRDFLPVDIQGDEKVVQDPSAVANKRRLALKNLYYSTIPWRMLEALGKFSLALTKQDNIYAQNEERLFQDALPDLIRDFQFLTRSFGSIIDYFYEEKIGEILWNLPHRPSFNGIRTLGSFVRDKDSFTRITNSLQALLQSSDTSSLKYRYAVLRTLNIIGEAGIFLSPQLKHLWMDAESWSAFKAIRDAFHDSPQQLRLHRLLLNTEDKIFLPKLVSNFRSLYERINVTLPFSPTITWTDITNFYSHPVLPQDVTPLESILDLRSYITGHLLQDERIELLKAIEAYYQQQQEPEKALRKLLLEDETIDRDQRNLFFLLLDQIALTITGKKSLEKAYKKRCDAEKQQKESQLDPKDKDRVEKALAMLKPNQDEVKKIIGLFHILDNWETLKKKLETFGIQAGPFFDLWEKYFQTLHQRTSLSEKKIPKEKVIPHQINELNIALRKIKDLFNEYVDIPPLKRLDRYQADPLISLASEYLFSSLRQQAQNLWDKLANFNDGKHPIIAPTVAHLDKVILRTKAILHNHDLTTISSTTQKGHEFHLIIRDIPALLDEWLDMEFLLNDSSYTMTLWDGVEISVPIVDARAIPPKENPQAHKKIKEAQRKKRKAFLEQYPKLSHPTQFFSRRALMSPGENEFMEFRKKLTVEDRFLLYTPPAKTKDALQAHLQKLLQLKTLPNTLKSPIPISYITHTCLDEHGGESDWEEHPMPADNDCALHCLGISRKDAVRLLLDHSHNPVIRDLVAPEIIEAFREDRLPKKMKYQALKEQYIQASQDLDEACRQANDELKNSVLQADVILSQNELSSDAYIVKLRSCVSAMSLIMEEIDRYAKKEETYKDFIQHHVGRQGEWLGYIRGLGNQMQTSTLDAIAYFKGVNLKISVHNLKTRKLTLVHLYSSGFTETIHMYHTSGLTHFNLLKPK